MKRPRDMFDTPASSSPPVHKRRQPIPSSPSLPYTLPRLPLSSPWALATPHDSPSNPFGLNPALRALTLPRPTGFGKHIVLRMQLVSTADPPPRTRPSRRYADAPFRVVQVPLNYTFRLLHMLILFLFASDARLQVRRRRVFSPPPRRPRDSVGETYGAGSSFDGDQEGGDGQGHLFEVLDRIAVCSLAGQRPGQIRAGTGKLYARLSSARERKLFPDPDDGADDTDSDGDGAYGWDWEAEDDFTLSNVWTEGLDLKKGIIYQHTPETYVHITVNQTKVPGRKGTGNTPYVFVARGGTLGAVRIAHVAPKSVPLDDEKENKDAFLSRYDKGNAKAKAKTRRKSRTAKDGPSLTPPEDLEDVPDLAEMEEADAAQLERWNAADTFQRFLRREAARERAMRRSGAGIAETPPASPGHTKRGVRVPTAGSSPLSSARRKRAYPDADADTGSSPEPSSSASAAPSSPSTLPIVLPSSDRESWSDLDRASAPGTSSDWAEGDTDEDDAGKYYSIALPLQTPFPAHPAVRRRISRASMRLERHTSKGLSEMSEDEEEDVDAEGEADEDQQENEGGQKAAGEARVAAKTKTDSGERKGPKPKEKGKGKEKCSEWGESPSEDATARRAAAAVPFASAPAVASAPASPLAPCAPPVVAKEDPRVVAAPSGRYGERPPRTPGGTDAGDEEDIWTDYVEEEGEKAQDSIDEGWEIGQSIWGLGPVPPDWDSEDEQ